MINRVPGFLADVRFGSSPRHPLPILPSVCSTGDTQDWNTEKERKLADGRGGGRGGERRAKSWPKESLVLYKSFNILFIHLIWQRRSSELVSPMGWASARKLRLLPLTLYISSHLEPCKLKITVPPDPLATTFELAICYTVYVLYNICLSIDLVNRNRYW
jgi:hypothetical protein